MLSFFNRNFLVFQISVEPEPHMFCFATPAAALTLTEGHICPYCDSLGASGNFCGTCLRVIPFTAQSEVLAQSSSKGCFSPDSKKNKMSQPLAKRYETKFENGLFVVTRRRTSKNFIDSEPERKKARPNVSKCTSRDKIIDRFCMNNFVSNKPKSSKNSQKFSPMLRKSSTGQSVVPGNQGSPGSSSSCEALTAVDKIIPESNNQSCSKFVIPIETLGSRKCDPVKTAVVAPYFGEKRHSAKTTNVFSQAARRATSTSTVPTVSVQQRTGHQQGQQDDNRQRNSSQQLPPVVSGASFDQTHITVSSSTSLSNLSDTQVTLPQNHSLSNQQPNSVTASRHPIQIQVLLQQQQTSQQQQQPQQRQQQQQQPQQRQQSQQQQSAFQTHFLSTASNQINTDVILNSQTSQRNPVQRTVISTQLQQQIQHQLQLRRQNQQTRPAQRRQTVQAVRTAPTVVSGQTIAALPGRFVYVQQTDTPASSVSSAPAVNPTPLTNTALSSHVRPSVTVGVSIPVVSNATPTPTRSTHLESESDELVIIGLSGVTRAANGSNASDNESTHNLRSGSQSSSATTTKYIEKFVYAPRGNDGITITNEDVLLLNEENYLNDVLIDFYLKYVYHAQLTTEQQNVTYIFNSFFYTRLTQKMPTDGREAMQGHASVAKWTRRVNLFEKDFVLIPINENSHWFLAIICFPWLVGTINYAGLLGSQRERYATAASDVLNLNILSESQRQRYDRLHRSGIEPMPCILMFDSLIGQSRSPNVKILRDYLQCEWNLKCASHCGDRFFNKDTIRGFSPKVPQQPNGYDCGVFVLYYAELFYRRPVRSFTKAYFQNEMDGWFEVHELNKKRQDMRGLIIDLWRGCQQEAESNSADNSQR